MDRLTKAGYDVNSIQKEVHESYSDYRINRYHHKIQIPRKAGRYCFGKEDLFAQVIILKIFLQEEDFALFYTELKQCFGKHPIYETVLYKMGFPENWKKIAVEKYENHKETL